MGLLSNVELNNTTYGIRSTAIPYGEVDSTSTSTAYTATIPEIKELSNGICMFLKNGVVTSAANFTININNLGAKPSYNNMTTGYEGTAPTRDTTIFNVNYTMFFVYSEDIVDGGGWICYRGYDGNTNTIGYQLRTNSTIMVTSDASRYYKIYFTSADGTKWVPAAANTSNSATSAKTVNQRPINPFGRIVYMSASTNFAAGANLTATAIWDQYNVTLGYSFNRTGAALTLTTKTPVYIKCAPQSDGSAIIDADNPYVQDLPSTADGKIYIFLGIATSATQVEIVINHPIYYYKDGAIRLWTNAADSGVTSITAGTGLSGGTITSTGTIALADTYGDTKNPYGTKNANTVLAGPSSGSAAAPSFRALVDADIPKTNSYSATGTTAITGTGVAAALDTLDSSIAADTGMAIASIAITNGKISNSSKISVGETNQNAFSNVKVGNTTIAADSKTDTLEVAADSPVTLTPDATNDKITASLVDAYGDIKNPYGAKSAGQVLATGAPLYKYSNYIVAGSTPELDYTVAILTLPAGDYVFSADLYSPASANSYVVRNRYVVVEYGNNHYASMPTFDQYTIDEIDTTCACAFTLSAETSVTFKITGSNTSDFNVLPFTFSNIQINNGATTPSFRYLTSEDLPFKITNVLYATSTTNHDVRNKVAILSDASILSCTITTGTLLMVNFVQPNSVSNASLILKSNNGDVILGATYIRLASGGASSGLWDANHIINMVYDGSMWVILTGYQNDWVKQSIYTNSYDYDVLLSGYDSSETSSYSYITNRSPYLKFNPSTQILNVGGTITVGSAPSTDMQVATKKYVDDQVISAGSGTVTSITAGTNLQVGDGTGEQSITTTGTLNHAPSGVTAKSIQGLYSITFDAQGHITSSSAIGLDPTLFVIKADGIWPLEESWAEGINCYGVCDTANSTAAKTVSITAGDLPDGSGADVGTKVIVKFTNGSSVEQSTPTLQVNNSSAAPIAYNGTALSDFNLMAGAIVEFVYDGTNWCIVGISQQDIDDLWAAVQSSDTKVTQEPTSSNANMPVVLSATTGAANTSVVYRNDNFTFNPSSGTLTATNLRGALTSSQVTSALGYTPPTNDTKVTNTLGTTTKYYVTGTTSSTTNTGTQTFDTGIYSTTTAGQLNATTYKVNEQVTLQWNSTDASLDFIFS